jgi:hypothetical protein
MQAAVAAYCATDAAPSEARGCRNVQRAFDTCDERLSVGDNAHASVRDPKNGSYAWILTFADRGATLLSFRYLYDDCDCC